MSKQTISLLCAILALFPWQTLSALETGDAVPNCALTPIGDTQRYDLKQFRGKVLYIDFWASWCGPCAKSFPFLNDLNNQFKDRGLQIIGINLDEKSNDAQDFLAKYPANFIVAADTGEQCVRDFGVKAMPSSYLVDRKGIIRHVHLGFRAGEAKELQVLVEQLLAETAAEHP